MSVLTLVTVCYLHLLSGGFITAVRSFDRKVFSDGLLHSEWMETSRTYLKLVPFTDVRDYVIGSRPECCR